MLKTIFRIGAFALICTLITSCGSSDVSPTAADGSALSIVRIEALSSGDTLTGFLITGTGFEEFMTAKLSGRALAYEFDSETLARAYLGHTVQEGTHVLSLAKRGETVDDSVTILRGRDGRGISWQGSLTSAPENPDTNWAYHNSLRNTAYIWDGTDWQVLIEGFAGVAGTDGISIVWQGTSAEHLSEPQQNWAYYNSTDGVSYIYTGTQWDTMAVNGSDGLPGADGQNGSDGSPGADGADGLDGISIIWQGMLDAAPSAAEENWAYYNTTDKNSYIYTGSAWDTLAVSGTDGADGSDGTDGISIVWQGTLATSPSSPEQNWAYYNSSDGVSYIYTGTQWDTMAVNGSDGLPGADGQDGSDGAPGSNGVDGADGLDGIAIIWQGMLATAPSPAEENWAYYNTTDKNSYIYSGSAWDTLAVSGTDGADGSDGTDAALVDSDGNVYRTVVIGNQEWTVENWRSTKYADGTEIPHVTDPGVSGGTTGWQNLSTPGYCWYDNDIANKHPYGALYNWYVVDPSNPNQLAPEGWRVPTDADWTALEDYLTANLYNYDFTTSGNKVAKSMATQSHWTISSNAGAIGNNLMLNNASGFSALPGGYRNYNGNFFYQSTSGFWWSATEFDASTAYNRNLSYNLELLHRSNGSKKYGFSVRLVRDLN